MIDWTRPLETNDGRPCTLLCECQGKRVVKIEARNGVKETIAYADEDGMYDVNEICNRPTKGYMAVRIVTVENDPALAICTDIYRRTDDIHGSFHKHPWKIIEVEL